MKDNIHMTCKRGSFALIIQVQQLLLLSPQQASVDASLTAFVVVVSQHEPIEVPSVIVVSQQDPTDALATRVAPVTMKELA